VLNIVVAACQFQPDRSKGVVVVESDLGSSGGSFQQAFSELESQDAVNVAQRYAVQCGCAPARLNGNKIGPYPVNSEGLSLEHVKDGNGNPLPPQHPRMQPARYRLDVPVCQPLM
jgi:hypothetical protein